MAAWPYRWFLTNLCVNLRISFWHISEDISVLKKVSDLSCYLRMKCSSVRKTTSKQCFVYVQSSFHEIHLCLFSFHFSWTQFQRTMIASYLEWTQKGGGGVGKRSGPRRRVLPSWLFNSVNWKVSIVFAIFQMKLELLSLSLWRTKHCIRAWKKSF